MLEFYFADHCPYCVKVREYLEKAGIAYKVRPVVVRDDKNHFGNQLRKRAGKAQVPYMIDKKHDIEMYESDDIIKHLKKHHKGHQQG